MLILSIHLQHCSIVLTPNLHNEFQNAPHYTKMRKNFSLSFATFFSNQRHSFFFFENHVISKYDKENKNAKNFKYN